MDSWYYTGYLAIEPMRDRARRNKFSQCIESVLAKSEVRSHHSQSDFFVLISFFRVKPRMKPIDHAANSYAKLFAAAEASTAILIGASLYISSM